jgi:hypothetical protein
LSLAAYFCCFAFAIALWGFSLGTLTDDQRRLLVWVLPLASGFAAAAFAGSIFVQARNVVPGIVVTATGGFAIWFITFFYLFPERKGSLAPNPLPAASPTASPTSSPALNPSPEIIGSATLTYELPVYDWVTTDQNQSCPSFTSTNFIQPPGGMPHFEAPLSAPAGKRIRPASVHWSLSSAADGPGRAPW